MIQDATLSFFTEDCSIPFSDQEESILKEWLLHCLVIEQATYSKIHFIFCSDAFLLQLNQEYLQHDTLTDIITFPYQYEPIETEIYISVERVRDNAQQRHLTFDHELRRVLAHGLLHMLGAQDKEESEKQEMRQWEDRWLQQWDTYFAHKLMP